ncbi:MAG: hypothetical protein JXR91_13280 [Deltaproteobacteria bacterium]|nr:hypothetical protein [Deltaproteobacteria bacterium]
MSGNKRSEKTEEDLLTSSYPVICSNCTRFALANLNGTPLCWKCLYSTVQDSNKGELLEIVPLENFTFISKMSQ